MRYFITGIGTGVGKTVISSILVQAFGWHYWKPVQTGTIEDRDRETVSELSGNRSLILPPLYEFKEPLSPHAASELENVVIDPRQIIEKASHLPTPVLIEGAGGLHVPLTDEYLIADLVKDLEAKVILVSRHYLGSINHTLLTLEVLHRRELPLAALLFVGPEIPATERVILERTKGIPWCRIPEWSSVDVQQVQEGAGLVRSSLFG